MTKESKDLSRETTGTEDLQTSEVRYRRLFESARDGILILNFASRKITDANPFMVELLGYSRAEFLGKELWEIGLLKDEEASKAAFRELKETGYIRYDDMPLETKAGGRRELEFVSNVYIEGARKVIQCNIRDITERKRTAEALRENEARFIAQIESQSQRLNNIVTTIPGVVWEAWGEPDAATQRIDFVSDHVEDMLGYSVEEWLATPNFWLTIIHPDDREYAAHEAAISFASGSNCCIEFRWLTKDGRAVWVESNFMVIRDDQGQSVGLRGVNTDISKRKIAEELSRVSEERYRSLFDSNPVPMWVADLETLAFLAVNDAAISHYGYSREEFLSMSTHDLSPPAADTPLLDNTRANSGKDAAGVCSQQKKDGSIISVEIKSHELTFKGRRAALVLANDIGERRRSEEMQIRRTAQLALRADVNVALAESEGLLERTLELCTEAAVKHLGAAFAGIWTFQQDENVLELQASSGIHTPFGMPYSRVAMGAFKIGLIAQTRQPHITNDVQRDPRVSDIAWAQREGIIAFAGYPLTVEDRLVGVMAIYARHQLARDTVEALASIADTISQDIERKHVEEALGLSEAQFRQSQKLEAVGQLAGGVAHDFNNLLTVIYGYTQLSMDKVPADNPLWKNLQEIRKAAERAASLTRQLLAFSRKQVLQPKVLCLNTVVYDLQKMLRRLIGEDIELRITLATDLGNVKADPGQIEQVIMNLAVNARDAMPLGGKLTIETENVHLEGENAKQHVAVNGDYVMLVVTDTGSGMDEAIRKRIFEPFFTTKAMGKGTGLGLSTVYGIVKQSGGDIWAYSEPGHGTTFKIYLERVDEPDPEPREDAEVEEDMEGTETILLAEDEEVVRRLTADLLKKQGYQVLEAANGTAALLTFERHRGTIDLVITDVVMPEMSGRELVDRLVTLRADVKVLYMSGYTDDAIIHHGVLDAETAFIQKPFTPNDLVQKVREVLEADKSNV
jgi:two-component system cell cycle sensor histidine kinase/response regulator CckA